MIVPNLADPLHSRCAGCPGRSSRDRTRSYSRSSGGDAALEEAELQIMLRRQIDGVVLMAASSGKSNLKLCWQGMCDRVFDEPLRGEEVDTITVTTASQPRSTEHLLAHGYKRILAVGARPHLYTCSERVAGYRLRKERGSRTIECWFSMRAI